MKNFTVEPIINSKLTQFVKTNGRFPAVSLLVKPLNKLKQEVRISNFVDYRFNSSVIVPVDTFSFTIILPGDGTTVSDYVEEGDIVLLQANDETISTGLIDSIEISTTQDQSLVTLTGRDLMGQLEDHSAISTSDKPIYGNKESISSGVRKLIANTKIKTVDLTDGAPTGADYLLATIPGESKLNALQRFLEPLNCLAWSNKDGEIRVGKPDMAQDPSGTVLISKEQRMSNVLAMKVIRASTQIPNIILPIWSGQETVQNKISPERRMLNQAEGPKRLRESGMSLPRAIVVSTPVANNAQGLADLNRFASAGKSNILQAYAKREIARTNFSEIQVQCVVHGHFDDDLNPFITDTVYSVSNDVANVDENMYLYAVDYSGNEDSGPRTTLYFCRLGTIVADNKYTKATLVKARGALATATTIARQTPGRQV